MSKRMMPFTITLDQQRRDRLGRAQQRLSLGSIRPSLSEIVREAIDRGLDILAPEGVSTSPVSGTGLR